MKSAKLEKNKKMKSANSAKNKKNSANSAKPAKPARREKSWKKLKKGVLVVIDGIDGAGKGTQTQLLVNHLIEERIPYQILDFPQYGNTSAYFVEKYLRGEYGGIDEVGPRKASLFYALDRFDKSFDLKKWLAAGKVVISNRYTTSNIGHQAAKIENDAGREKFLDWLAELEYDFLGIPKPDLVICLYLPVKVSQRLVLMKKSRAYTNGLKKDIHEDDANHLQKASDRYLAAAKKYGWEIIDCSATNEIGILPPDEIHKKIFEVIKTKNIFRKNEKSEGR